MLERLVVDKARKGFIELKPPPGERGLRYFYKIEKGELYLVLLRAGDVRGGEIRVKPDFSGKTTPVIILTREKK